MRLEAGQPAPAISGETTTGGEVTPTDLAGQHVLLKFYRFAYCPICNLHLREYVRRVDELSAAGITVVGVFHSPSRKLRKTLRRLDVPFAVLADPGKKLFDAYGVEQSARGMFRLPVWKQYGRAALAGFFSRPVGHEGGIRTHPADFLVAPDGTLEYVHYGNDYADSMTVDDVLAVLTTGATTV